MTDTTEVEKWRPVHGGEAWVRVTDYQDNIEMIRACVKVLQWFTMDNYEHELAEVNKYSLSIGEMF